MVSGSVASALWRLSSSFFTGVLERMRLLRGLVVEGPLLTPVEVLAYTTACPTSPCLLMSIAQSSPAIRP